MNSLRINVRGQRTADVSICLIHRHAARGHLEETKQIRLIRDRQKHTFEGCVWTPSDLCTSTGSGIEGYQFPKFRPLGDVGWGQQDFARTRQERMLITAPPQSLTVSVRISAALHHLTVRCMLSRKRFKTDSNLDADLPDGQQGEVARDLCWIREFARPGPGLPRRYEREDAVEGAEDQTAVETGWDQQGHSPPVSLLWLGLTWCIIMTGTSESCTELSSVSTRKSPNGDVDMYKRV